MLLDWKAVLRIVDTATRFSAETFLDSRDASYGPSVEDVWFAFVITWYVMYKWYPNTLLTWQRSIFTSARWRQLTDIQGNQRRLSGIGAHSSLGIGERYHEPIRRIYRKIQLGHPRVPPGYILCVASKAINDTIGEHGLVPSRLVFGILPCFSVISTDLPIQK